MKTGAESTDLKECVRACVAHLQAGRLNDLETLARAALARHPQASALRHLLGVALLSDGRLSEAVLEIRAALDVAPGNAAAWDHLGVTLQRLGDHVEAARAFERSLAIRPDAATVWSNAAVNACDRKLYETAIEHAQRALALDANLAPACLACGNALSALGRLADAVNLLERAVGLAPGLIEAKASLGGVYGELGRESDALRMLEPVVGSNPQDPISRTNYAQALYRLGRIDEAIPHYRAAIAADPSRIEPWNGYLFALTHLHSVTPDALFAAHREFGEVFEAPWRDAWGGWLNDRDPERRLRVGFVSGDLREHAIAHFIEPVWASLDREQFALHVYHNYSQEDATSARLRGQVDAWSNVNAVTDDELFDRIRADRIDILFDLSGHTAYNRLAVFARKPAPVQVSWLGYPNTTGLKAMDYRLVNGAAFSGRDGDCFFTEHLVRLGMGSQFAPPPDLPDVSPLPALSQGFFMFGSFNRPAKIGKEAVELWSKVLHRVPTARMTIGAISDPALEERLGAMFEANGIDRVRLVFKPRVALGAYLKLHNDVDLLLDCFPYTGGTTTNLALWMGVPTLTLMGEALQQRQGAGVMLRSGLSDWVVKTQADFVAVAVAVAEQPAPLAGLRSRLRDQVMQVARSRADSDDLGVAVRMMWQRWCHGLPSAPIDLFGPMDKKRAHEAAPLADDALLIRGGSEAGG